MCRRYFSAMTLRDIATLVVTGLSFIIIVVWAMTRNSGSGNVYHRTVCTVESVNDTEVMPCDYCDYSSWRTCTTDENNTRTCTRKSPCYTSQFPCAKINVSYTPKGSSSAVQSYLHKRAYTKRAEYPLCAMIICLRNEEDNFSRVKQFTDIWSRGVNSTCYYHEDRVDEVIAMKMYGGSGLNTKVLGICMVLLLIAIGSVAYNVYRRRKAMDRIPEDQDGKVLAAPPTENQQSYPMQPMPPQPTNPPPQMPPTEQPQAYPPPPGMPPPPQAYPPPSMPPPQSYAPPGMPPPQSYAPPGMPPPQPYPGYQQGPYTAPPPPAGAYPPPGGAQDAPQQGGPPTYNPEMQPLMTGGPVPSQPAGPEPTKV